MDNLNDPLRNLQRQITGIMSSVPKFYTPSFNNLNYSTSIEKPSILMAQDFRNDMFKLHLPYLNHIESVKTANNYESMLNRGIWHTLNQNKNKVEKTNGLQTKIQNFYNPIESVLSAQSLAKIGTDLQYKFPKGLIDFSKNDVIGESFNHLKIVLNNFLFNNGNIRKEPFIQDSLNLALNADYETINSGDGDDIIATYIIDDFLIKIGKYLDSISVWAGEKFDDLIDNFSKNYKTYLIQTLLYFMVSSGDKIVDIAFDKIINSITNVDGNHSTTFINNIEITDDKELRKEPNENSYLVCNIPKGTIIEILDNDGAWINITYINDGINYTGWTLNSNLKR